MGMSLLVISRVKDAPDPILLRNLVIAVCWRFHSLHFKNSIFSLHTTGTCCVRLVHQPLPSIGGQIGKTITRITKSNLFSFVNTATPLIKSHLHYKVTRLMKHELMIDGMDATVVEGCQSSKDLF